jgi:hypothetical protein
MVTFRALDIQLTGFRGAATLHGSQGLQVAGKRRIAVFVDKSVMVLMDERG